LEQSFVTLYCAGTWTQKSRSEMPGKFLNVVLEMDGEDQLDDSVGNEEILQSHGGKEQPKYSTKKES